MVDGIRHMFPPTTGARLQQFACAVLWMRSAISKFTNVISRLSYFPEKFCKQADKETREGVSRVYLSSLSWGFVEVNTFKRCKSVLKQNITLCHHDCNLRLCVYTVDCDLHWMGIVIQIPHEIVGKNHIDQQQQPHCFLSGNFTGLQPAWSTLEKEACVIMATINRMH